MTSSQSFDAYLDVVCDQLPWTRRAEVRSELRAHLDDRVDGLIKDGLTRTEAQDEALRRFGDPQGLGEELRCARSRGVSLWAVLLGVFLLTACGAAVLTATDSQYLSRHLQWIAIGTVLLVGASFLRTPFIEKSAPSLYAVVAAVNVFVAFFGYEGPARSYLRIGSLNLDVHAVSPILFLVALSGLLPRILRKPRGLPLATALLIIPCISLGLFGAEASGMSLAVAGAVTMIAAMSGLQKRFALGSVVLVVVLGLGAFSTWWMPLKLSFTATGPLPDSHTDQIFAQGILSYGVFFAVAVLAAVYFLGSWLVKIVAASKPVIALFVTGIGVLLAVELLWNVGWGLGVLPVTNSGTPALPFMSYGGSHTVLHLAAVGLLLGHLRRSRKFDRDCAVGSG